MLVEKLGVAECCAVAQVLVEKLGVAECCVVAQVLVEKLGVADCCAVAQVLVEKLGVADSRLNATLRSQRMQPDGTAEPVCGHYASS